MVVSDGLSRSISGLDKFERDPGDVMEFDTVDGARDAAMAFAAASGGRVVTATLFTQGGRSMFSTALPFSYVSKNVIIEPAPSGGSGGNFRNRPLMADHVRTIHDYLLRNRNEYILPGVTIAVRKMPPVYVQKGNAAVRSCFLVLDDSTVFYMTDGQHRIAALAGYSFGKTRSPGVLDIEPEFGSDGLAVVIVVEPEIARMHQDFADAAQTKPIPPSLLAVYNTREASNQVLLKIVDRSGLLKGRVDETSKTLPKLSQKVFLMNQVRALVKELLVGDSAVSEESLARSAAARLSTPAQQADFVDQSLKFLETLTDHMEPWKTIVGLPVGSGLANRIPDFRAEYVNMTATGLAVLGRTAYQINKLPAEAERLAKYVELATKIDWKRSASIWQGAIVIEAEDRNGNKVHKLLTNRAQLKEAASRVKKVLGV